VLIDCGHYTLVAVAAVVFVEEANQDEHRRTPGLRAQPGGVIGMASKDFRGRIERHPVASFFVLTYATSWLAWLPAVLGYRGDLNQSRG
jgi:hypothetical protein